jgi:hypothetical protein
LLLGCRAAPALRRSLRFCCCSLNLHASPRPALLLVLQVALRSGVQGLSKLSPFCSQLAWTQMRALSRQLRLCRAT